MPIIWSLRPWTAASFLCHEFASGGQSLEALQTLCVASIPEIIGGEIEKACQGIFPLQNVFIRKVKMLKKPKFDLTKLMEMYGDSGEDTGAKVSDEPAVVETLAGSGGRL